MAAVKEQGMNTENATAAIAAAAKRRRFVSSTKDPLLLSKNGNVVDQLHDG